MSDDNKFSTAFMIAMTLAVALVFAYRLPSKLEADINASKAQVRGAAALERIADILEGTK